VAPAPIEGRLKEDFLIEQAMVVGDQKKFVSAVIVPAVDALKAWCEENQIAWTSISDIIHHPKVLEKYQQAIDEVNKDFSHIEQIKKFALIPQTWEATRNDGTEAELTPTMKLKRRVILDKFADVIDKIYENT